MFERLAPAPTPASPAAYYLGLLEQMLALRQEAVFAVDRLLAGPPDLGALAAARARVQGLAAESAEILDHVERAVGPPRRGQQPRRPHAA